MTLYDGHSSSLLQEKEKKEKGHVFIFSASTSNSVAAVRQPASWPSALAQKRLEVQVSSSRLSGDSGRQVTKSADCYVSMVAGAD